MFGVRVWLDLSWFPILALVSAATAVNYRDLHPGLGTGGAWVMGVCTGLAFFACLLAHELSHAVVARRLGVPVRGITLFLLGGVAEIAREVDEPGDELAIALAGPGMSVGLGGIFAVAAAGLGDGPAGTAAATLAAVNVVLAGFNLVPGLPLDGGRILRAAIWRATGKHDVATRVAVGAGRLFALALFLLGAVLAFQRTLTGAWYMVVAWFLDGAARAAGRSSTVRRVLAQVPVSALMRDDLRPLAGVFRAGPRAEEPFRGQGLAALPVVDETGRFRGMVRAADFRGAPEGATAAELARGEPAPLDPDDAASALRFDGPDAVVPVVDRGGRLRGVVTPASMGRAVALARHEGAPQEPRPGS